MQKTDACLSVARFDQDIDSVLQQIQLPEFCALDYLMYLFQVEIHLSSFSPSLDGKPSSVLAWLALSLLAIGILLALSI